MPKDIGEIALDFHELEGKITKISPFSKISLGQFPIKSPAPSPPVISEVITPEHTTGVLEILLELPTTNHDATYLAPGEIIRLRLHYSDSPGTDISDPYVDFGISETLVWAPNSGGTKYIAVRVMDSHGSWSVLSNEESGAPEEPEVPEADIWSHRLGKHSIFTDDSPNPGSVAWHSVILHWKDDEYEINNDATEDLYIYWDHNFPYDFQTSETAPNITKDDVLIGINDGGSWRLMVYSPMIIADFLRAGKIQSGNWSESEGSELDLGEGEIRLGGYSSPSFEVDKNGILRATGAEISGTLLVGEDSWLGSSNAVVIEEQGINLGNQGYIRAGKSEYGSGSGIWAGYHDGAYKIDIGSGDFSHIRWDGSSLSIRGSVNASDIDAGTLNVDRIAVNTIHANRIVDESITGGKVGYKALTEDKIDSVHANDISAGTIIGSSMQTAESPYKRMVLDAGVPALYVYEGESTDKFTLYESLLIANDGFEIRSYDEEIKINTSGTEEDVYVPYWMRINNVQYRQGVVGDPGLKSRGAAINIMIGANEYHIRLYNGFA